MRGLGISALILLFLSFLFWLFSWVFWNFLYDKFDFDSPLRYVATASGVLSTLTDLLAAGLLAVGLIIAAKRLPKV